MIRKITFLAILSLTGSAAYHILLLGSHLWWQEKRDLREKMDGQQIREQFIEMYGYDEFKQWTFAMVNSLGTNRMDDYYWLKWEKFMEVNKEIPDNFSEVRCIFLYCHVHKKELLQDQIKRSFYDKKILQRITHRKRTSKWYTANLNHL